jgi:RNA polymerase sigma factor (sigma-70 family)
MPQPRPLDRTTRPTKRITTTSSRATDHLTDQLTDAALIASVRAGNVQDYEPLYRRHIGAAYHLARQVSRTAAEADDLVAEAFTRVLQTLLQGHTDLRALRPYLLTTLRHLAYEDTRNARTLVLAADVTTVAGPTADAFTAPFHDTAVASLDRSMAATAFARLPERWRTALRHIHINGQKPADLAPLLGLAPRSVPALAARALRRLREEFLQAHLTPSDTAPAGCRTTADRLGAWIRGGLARQKTGQVDTHLAECRRCRAWAAELADTNAGLAA